MVIIAPVADGKLYEWEIDGAPAPGLSGQGQKESCGGEMSERLKAFDEQVATVTQRRGAVYGAIANDFGRAMRLKAVVAECDDVLVRHVLEMLCVKMARLINCPDHLDSWIDIAGYARCGVMASEKPSAILKEVDSLNAASGS